jgi:hypothetical protein
VADILTTVETAIINRLKSIEKDYRLNIQGAALVREAVESGRALPDGSVVVLYQRSLFEDRLTPYFPGSYVADEIQTWLVGVVRREGAQNEPHRPSYPPLRRVIDLLSAFKPHDSAGNCIGNSGFTPTESRFNALDRNGNDYYYTATFRFELTYTRPSEFELFPPTL